MLMEGREGINKRDWEVVKEKPQTKTKGRGKEPIKGRHFLQNQIFLPS